VITVQIAPVQLVLLKQALEIELKHKGMQLTREPALRIYKRLIADQAGMTVGRGVKGREDALFVVEDLLAQIGK
jgi:hypothetical protein